MKTFFANVNYNYTITNMSSIVISTLDIDLYFAYKVFLLNYFDESEKEINIFHLVVNKLNIIFI